MIKSIAVIDIKRRGFFRMKRAQTGEPSAFWHQLDPLANQIRQGCAGAQLFDKFRRNCQFICICPLACQNRANRPVLPSINFGEYQTTPTGRILPSGWQPKIHLTGILAFQMRHDLAHILDRGCPCLGYRLLDGLFNIRIT